jgi:hypothetical protein
MDSFACRNHPICLILRLVTSSYSVIESRNWKARHSLMRRAWKRKWNEFWGRFQQRCCVQSWKTELTDWINVLNRLGTTYHKEHKMNSFCLILMKIASIARTSGPPFTCSNSWNHRGIPRLTLEDMFRHWMEGLEWVSQNNGDYYP